MTSEKVQSGPAIASIELTSIARGIRVVDEMAKRAPIHVLEATAICPGKFLVVIGGMTDPVLESYAAGLALAGDALVDKLFLPNAHPQLMPAISMSTRIERVESLGVVETFASAAGILAADASCKRAAVQLIELRLARGLAGKAFYTMTGAQHEIEVAVQAAREILAKESGLLLWTEVIPNPHADLVAKIL